MEAQKKTKKQIKVHTISDFTGETIQGLSRAVAVQFENVVEQDWTLIKSRAQIEKIIDILDENSVVAYTIAEKRLIDILKNGCRMKKAICITPMTQFSRAIVSLGGEVSTEFFAGKQHALDDEYFARMQAINFAVHQDDGQNPDQLMESDIIILGVSRTSKSPTSLYLANRGLSVSNVPFISKDLLPSVLLDNEKLSNQQQNANVPLVVALTRDAKSLVEIRRSRLESMAMAENTDYVDIEKVKDEILQLKRLCTLKRWAIINVTKKSVEETATQIIKYFEKLKT